ncbi:hypothetical protein AB6A23_11205 [Paenibacillus tarimensis]
MAYWGSIRGIRDPVPIRSFRGVYKPEDEGFNLPDDLFTELINFCPDEFPAITTRPGYTVVGTFGTRVLGLGSWKDTELHAMFNDGTWRRLNGDGTWTTLASLLNTSAEWSFCNFKGNLGDINLIESNGVDPIKRYDGLTVQDLANAPVGGNFICTQANRLYCAVGNSLRYSALNKADDWTTVNEAGEIVYNTANGELINGLNAGTGHVTVFKPSSIAELYGTGPTSYKLDDDVSTDIGATGNKAIAVHDAAFPFISRDGLYHYGGGLRPRKDFSDPVYQFMIGANKSELSKCAAGSDGRYMYFGIPYGLATEVNRILQYDPNRKGWYTWDNIAVTQMIRVGKDFYFGDATGRVLRAGGTTDGGNAITATAITKPFTAGSMARKQQWFKLYVVASIPTGSSLSIYVSGSASGDNWTLAKTLTAESEIQYKKILVPTNSIANVNAVRVKLVAAGPVTIHEITRQLREMPMR